MKLRKWLENWDLTGLKVNVGVLEAQWNPQEKDREAAWELYIEMITRIVTQPLPKHGGDENAALESVRSLFPITREILRRNGRGCVEFTKVAVIVLNQLVRPFTTKWHVEVLTDAFKNPEKKKEFRQELAQLQKFLRKYTRALADLAQVEDLTELEPQADQASLI
jgi:hypothetical protein